MKTIFVVGLLFLHVLIHAQEPVIPKGYMLLEEKLGDLDKDGSSEKVSVYNTTDSTEDGVSREIFILKKTGEQWNVWKRSTNAILRSNQGGMMGDPFQGIEIKNGLLIISLAGGSSWKWSQEDKYRFQANEFELIGYTSNTGKPCEYWINLDFNISTGKMIYKKEYEDCEKDRGIYKKEEEVFYKKGIKLNLGKRNKQEIRIVLPKYKHEVYL